MVAPIPFVEALAPWLKEAQRRLTENVPDLERVLTSSALATLIEGLAQELAPVTSPTLLERFLRYPGRRWFTPQSSVAYTQFVEELAAGGFDQVLDELPELARLIDQTVADWCHRVSRMIGRIRCDRRLLEARYAARLPFDSAVQIVDTAVELRNRSGARLLYKDRPLGMDAAFCNLLRWVNGLAPSRDLFVPCVIDRGEFGWMAYVPQFPAQEPLARQAYLVRVGMLLCLVHALGGGDVHAGNVRAFGEHPVIIDGEVLLRPRRAGEEAGSASVLATGWLPTLQEVERCGLAAEPYEDRPYRWMDVGTDAVRQRPLRSPLARMRPEVAEHFQRDRVQTIEWICEGFREMYALVTERGLPLDVFAESTPRVLLRTSYLYQETIERLLRPAALSSAATRARVIDKLVNKIPPALDGVPAVAEAVAAAECTSMNELQVPRFTIHATGRHLLWRGELLGEPFKQSPLQRARTFVAEMSSAAMEAHCRDIAAAVEAAADGSLQTAVLQFDVLTEFDPGAA